MAILMPNGGGSATSVDRGWFCTGPVTTSGIIFRATEAVVSTFVRGFLGWARKAGADKCEPWVDGITRVRIDAVSQYRCATSMRLNLRQ